MKIRIVVSMVIALLVAASHAQVLTMPNGWIETAEPSGPFEDNSPLECANYSPNEWRVEAVSGQLRITDVGNSRPRKAVFPPKFAPTKEMIGRALTLKVGNGWLLGFNDGEFGGGLWWASSDGSRTKPLTGENVQALIPRHDDVLVLTGLAHITLDNGTAYSFRAKDEGGDFARIADIGSAPSSAKLQKDGSALIAVTNGLVTLSSDGIVTRLYKQEDMSVLYPNSVVGDPSDLVFVGMRFYVLRLQRRSDGEYQPTWFKRSECRKTKMIKDYQCVCTGKPTDS
jgi:hypothetical protein